MCSVKPFKLLILTNFSHVRGTTTLKGIYCYFVITSDVMPVQSWIGSKMLFSEIMPVQSWIGTKMLFNGQF